MKNKFLVLLILIIIAGCTPTKSSYYSNINKEHKIIALPASNEYVSKFLKDAFRKNGWKVILAKTSTTKITGSTGKDTSLLKSLNKNVRYEAVLRQAYIDGCINFTHLVFFDLTIVDIKNGEQVFASTGQDCMSKIEKDLTRDLAKFFN
jgi:hypothetical protein